MDTRPRTPTSIRVPIAWKLFAVLALVVASLLAVSLVGGRGMVAMKEQLDAVYGDNLTSTRAIGSLAVALEEAEELSLRLVGEPDRPRAREVVPVNGVELLLHRHHPPASNEGDGEE